jgi:hypothetical protein
MGGLVGVEESVEPLGEEERRRGAGDGHGDGRGFFYGRGFIDTREFSWFPALLELSASVSGSKSKGEPNPQREGEKEAEVEEEGEDEETKRGSRPDGMRVTSRLLSLARLLALDLSLSLDQSERSV